MSERSTAELRPAPMSIGDREDIGTSVHSILQTELLVQVMKGGDTRRRKEGNVLFNDALNTFYLRLYGVRHMVKDHSDGERKE